VKILQKNTERSQQEVLRVHVFCTFYRICRSTRRETFHVLLTERANTVEMVQKHILADVLTATFAYPILT
jgi:hypothetical protein